MTNSRKFQGIALAGVFWSGLGQGGSFLTRFLGLVFLARLLTPDDYGVFSLAFLFVGLFTEVIRASFSRSLIQRAEITERHIRASFSLSSLAGLLAAGALWAAAPLAAWFFRAEELRLVLPVMALGVVFEALSTTARALLQRSMAFRRIALVEALSLAIGNYLLAITLAMLGFGVWALVFGQLGGAILLAALSYLYSPHSLAPLFEKKICNDILGSTAGFSLHLIANYLARSLDNAVVGKMLGAQALGIYGRAFNLFSLPINTAGEAFSKVIFPILSRINQDDARRKRAYMNSIAVCAAVMLPASAVLTINAEEVVLVLLGGKWLAAASPLAVLAAGLYPRFCYKVTENISLAASAVYSAAARQLVYAVLVFFGAVLGSRFGLTGVAAGVLLAILIFFLASAQLSNRITGTSWGEFLSMHRQAVGLALVAALPCFWVHEVTGWMGPALTLLLSGTAALAAMLLAATLFPGIFLSDAVQGVLHQLRQKIARKSA